MTDEIDRRLLAYLQKDGRISNQALAAAIHISPSACSRRLARMEARGLITRYAALLDADKIGRATTVYITVTLLEQSEKAMQAFESAISIHPDVMECHLMSGESDYLIKLAVRDLHDYETFHSRHLSRMAHVSRVRSSFALRTVKQTTIYEI